MNFLAKTCVRFRELRSSRIKGQTMTEYALILAAIGIAAFVAYTALGGALDQMSMWAQLGRDL